MEFAPVWYVPANNKGNDYVFGDLHGRIDLYDQAVQYLKIDGTVDRVFFVGDLVDRGPASIKCLELLQLPYVYSVRGNHEQMMFSTVLNNCNENAFMWFRTGGRWYLDNIEARDQHKQIISDCTWLPYVIVVGQKTSNRFNIVHASFPEDFSDDDVDTLASFKSLHDFQQGDNAGEYYSTLDEQRKHNMSTDKSIVESMLWCRSMISNVAGYDASVYDKPQQSLSTTYVGHTPLTQILYAGAQVYIDQAAVYSDDKLDELCGLTVVNHQTQQATTFHRTKQPVITKLRQRW